MNHYLIAADQMFKRGVVALPALLKPILFLLQIDHVALLLIKTNRGDKSFEKFLQKLSPTGRKTRETH
jgi:hypothetical protein